MLTMNIWLKIKKTAFLLNFAVFFIGQKCNKSENKYVLPQTPLGKSWQHNFTFAIFAC